ncbi:hypothetical protein J1614_011638 [Plenodomus biglobosus]|nr:hypothetical protein J1614_011638 [Plenodomus biglobosus]
MDFARAKHPTSDFQVQAVKTCLMNPNDPRIILEGHSLARLVLITLIFHRPLRRYSIVFTPEMAADRKETKSVGVFLGASIGNDPQYEELAQNLAALFAKNGWKLVYGGSPRGLMKVLSQTASDLGVNVHGVQARAFYKYKDNAELPKYGHHELVNDLHSQKRRIAELSDAILILPGGFGTLEEYTAIRLWSKLGVCRRPILLVNFQGFYTPLLDWINKATTLGFISQSSAALGTVVNSVEEIEVSLSRREATVDNPETFDWSVLVPGHISSMQPQLEELLLGTADLISLQNYLTVHWSTWHTWDYYNRVKPDETEANDHVWKNISPFSTCVGIAFQVARNLTAALRTTPGLASTRERLRTVACPRSADLPEPYHCLTGIFMDDYCVIIDPVFQAKAFKVPYNGSFETIPFITMSGHSKQMRFRYVAGISGEKVLTMEKVGGIDEAMPFSDIDHTSALRRISMYAAREGEPGSQVPSKKFLAVRSKMDEKPTNIPSTAWNAEFIVTACRVQIDFSERTLTMQIPSTDWLFKPENERYYLQVQHLPI